MDLIKQHFGVLDLYTGTTNLPSHLKAAAQAPQMLERESATPKYEGTIQYYTHMQKQIYFLYIHIAIIVGTS